MTSINTVQNTYISILELALTDPNDERRANGQKWIYEDNPNINLGGNKYPRISVLAANSTVEYHELCTNKYRQSVRVRILIRVKNGRKWYAGATTYTSEEFLDKMTDDVIEALRTDSAITQLRTGASIFYPKLEVENRLDNQDPLVKELIYNNVMVR